MMITYIITISPVIEIGYLKILINSLNFQNTRRFNVIFYNQTKNKEEEIFRNLKILCKFEYKFFSVKEKFFYGKYPLWDLYGFHQKMIHEKIVLEYFMSLHMEEFLEPEYTLNLLKILENNNLDILFGNLHRTKYWLSDVNQLGNIQDAASFKSCISNMNINFSKKWGLPKKPFFISKSWQTVKNNYNKKKALMWKDQFRINETGLTKLDKYLLEDVFAIKTKFAIKYNWFNSPIEMFFEDIHINLKLENALKEITEFPVYFNKSKIFHLEHKKYYYQIEDKEFTDTILKAETNNPIIISLKEAIKIYRDNEKISASKALKLSRKNPKNIGTADINYQFHINNIKRAAERDAPLAQKKSISD